MCVCLSKKDICLYVKEVNILWINLMYVFFLEAILSRVNIYTYMFTFQNVNVYGCKTSTLINF